MTGMTTDSPWSTIPSSMMLALDVVLRKLERTCGAESRVLSLWSADGRQMARVRCAEMVFRLEHGAGGWRVI